MSDILNKYLSPRATKDAARERGSFTFRQMVVFRRKTGESVAFSYPHLLWLDFDPSKAIVLHFSTHTVSLHGRNLAPLFEKLLSFEAIEVYEVSPRYDEPIEKPDETVVTQIDVKSRKKRSIDEGAAAGTQNGPPSDTPEGGGT
jgi:hypothetical protein